MRLHLPEPIHAAMIDDDFVFLDIDADAYFCLPLPPGLARLNGAQMETDDPLLAQELVAAGLARSGAAETLRARPPGAPKRTARQLLEYQAHGDIKIRPKHLRALVAAVRAALASRSRTFRQLVQTHARTKPEASELGLPALLADLAVWRHVSPWLPLDGVCLFRSGMLAAFLGALGHRTTWVFGVRTWPFQAHCWLQVDDVALDDEAERLCAFTPILGA